MSTVEDKRIVSKRNWQNSSCNLIWIIEYKDFEFIALNYYLIWIVISSYHTSVIKLYVKAIYVVSRVWKPLTIAQLHRNFWKQVGLNQIDQWSDQLWFNLVIVWHWSDDPEPLKIIVVYQGHGPIETQFRSDDCKAKRLVDKDHLLQKKSERSI